MDNQRKTRIGLDELVSSSRIALNRMPCRPDEIKSDNVLLLIEGVSDDVVELVERAYRKKGMNPLYALDGKALNGQTKKYLIVDLRQIELTNEY